ncbi:unnamed protein product [Fusarium graminearum]|uniref:Uncharacterized protein n=1 Tax=Gibberella zeae TaxID=5518 RepID=A0A4E9EQM3_GIBZA|nr:unnamed protein product [Fusarium graminearum]
MGDVILLRDVRTCSEDEALWISSQRGSGDVRANRLAMLTLVFAREVDLERESTFSSVAAVVLISTGNSALS